MLTRRTALLSSLAASACATAGGGEPADLRFANLTSLSESVHSGVASDDGELRCTVRLCRYPELGLAWIWMHARTPEGFFSYVDHLAASGADATRTDADRVRYSDTAGALIFERRGAAGRPTGASIVGTCMARKTPTSAFGKGAHSMKVEIEFSPARLYQGLNKGRTEVFGRSKAIITIDGKQTHIEGPGQFHEQGQTTPRFTVPFCYGTLWGTGDAASTLLITPKRREGYLLEGDKVSEVVGVRIDPPAARRAIHVTLSDGRSLAGEVRVVQAYTLPMVGNTWRGHMVAVQMPGRTFMGHVNDYIIGDGVPYEG
jgi:hypothetical protein